MKRFFTLPQILIIATIALVAFVLPNPMIGTLLIGGVITQGILGGFSGKVGPVVGGKWKNIDYMKSYVIPANPNTADQQTQRTRFTVILGYARQVLANLIQPYWDPFNPSMSGYNAIMQNWLLNADANDNLNSNCLASKGTLSKQLINSAVYTTGSGLLVISWTVNLVGNQLNSDSPQVLVFDKSSGKLYFLTSTAERVDASNNFDAPPGLTATNLETFTFFIQGTGSELIVSDSVHRTATAS